MKRLIVNADDLGLTEGVNRAIFELHQKEALTSATLMATSCKGWAAGLVSKDLGIGVGCHVVLVDGIPVLPSSDIPTLVDPDNPRIFRPSLREFAHDLLRGRIRDADIEAEAAAQIACLREMDVSPTHIDTHKHTHVFPRVLRPLLRAAQRSEVYSIRNPFEPAWSVVAAPGTSMFRRIQLRVLGSQRSYFLNAVRASGLSTTDGALGIATTGSLTATGLRNLLRAVPAGTWELVCHPGYLDSDLRKAHTRLLDSREIERTALLEVIPSAADDFGLTMIDFQQLVSDAV